jgi:hypothetical protein
MSQQPTAAPVTLVGRKRQKVDATIRLIAEHPELRREELTLRKIIDTARVNAVRRGLRPPLKTLPALYSRYRKYGFPIKDHRGRKLIRWRSLSPWMKTQIAALCLGEGRFLQIRLHLHEDLRADVGDMRIKEYVRDRLVRCIREEFGQSAWFYLVIEDRDTEGSSTVRPHLHGAIRIPKAPVPLTKDGRAKARFRRLMSEKGVEEAEYLAGRIKLDGVLKRATGNDGKRPDTVLGVSQLNNVWKRKPYFLFRNNEWVSYSLKNMDSVSPSLPVNRLSMSQPLKQEAQRLWELIRRGETALANWP